ncbi:THO complex subunit 4D-like isoform X2 [Cornus florida]|uniref:THO complex subunit 4D-like isoform X2 n=1 Tax=Cornus florida TaxID=4283 RepID=UPI00289AD47C|nr:THO complex subunit 4D-like isoform X2 [Cornus florida]
MASLDMSLDDMIKSRRNSDRVRGHGRARRGRGPGRSFSGGRMTGAPPRRGPLGVNTRPSSYAIAKSFRRTKGFPWQHDLFEDSLRAAGLTGVENGTKLYVSNLDFGVTNEDIRELFSEIGELKRYAVHFDANGRPSGSAEVVFSRRSDAFQALKRYNNVQLDGKPMKIEIIGANSEIPVSARVNVVGVNGRRTVVMASGMGRGRGSAAVIRGAGQRSRGGIQNGRGRGRGGLPNRSGRGRGRGRGGVRGQGRGRGGKKPVKVSADDLDKELETYHADAMQT